MSLKLTLRPITETDAKAAAKSPNALEDHVRAMLADLVESGVGTDDAVMAITDALEDGTPVGIRWSDLAENWPELTKTVEADSRGRGGKDAPKGHMTIVRKINAMHSASAESTSGLNARWQDDAGRYPAKTDDESDPKSGYLLIGRADMFRTRVVSKKDAE
jgi:hypothetical protein